METALLNYFVLNDELKSTCDFNPAPFQQGKPVYEVIRIINGKPLFFREHVERFYDSARRCGLKIEISPYRLAQRIRSLIQYNKMAKGNVEFVCHFDGQGKSNFYAWCAPFFYPTAKQYQEGVAVTAMNAERKSPNAKAFNRRLREEADKIIREQGVYEVLLVNRRGLLTEGSRSNLFLIKENALFTPPVTEVLPGVTRSRILRLCKEQTIPVYEKEISLEEVKNYPSMFLSGTSPKILPVNRFNGITFDVNNPLLRLLMNKLDRIIAEDIQRFDFEKVFR